MPTKRELIEINAHRIYQLENDLALLKGSLDNLKKTNAAQAELIRADASLPLQEVKRARHGPYGYQECNCKGWGCFGCCATYEEIRGKQGVYG